MGQVTTKALAGTRHTFLGKVAGGALAAGSFVSQAARQNRVSLGLTAIFGALVAAMAVAGESDAFGGVCIQQSDPHVSEVNEVVLPSTVARFM